MKLFPGKKFWNQRFLLLWLLVFLAAALNASMDVIEFHWDDSVFADIKNDTIREWFKSDSDKKFKEWNGIRLHPIFHDGWHFFKQWMIIVFILALAFVDWEIKPNFRNILVALLVFGISWWAGFTLFYNILLI